jgi:tetratricopeptide (TPR) repeat protein
MHRIPFVLSELPHLDFLFPARSLWGHKHENCRLFHLAREVVQADRSEDIPSAEIPMRYFQYLQTGNYDLIEPILYHNQEDILSLLGLVISGALIVSENEDSLADGMDYFGAGKIMEKIGETEKSLKFFERALEGSLTDKISVQTKKRLSYHFKKNKEWEKAVTLWQEMASTETVTRDHLFSFRELAMYFEHKEKKYDEAKKIAEEGYVLSLSTSLYFEKDFSRRLERLRKKLNRKS